MVRTTSDPNANSADFKRFTAYLDHRQLRKTPERLAIVRCALAFPRHFTIDELEISLDADDYHVSRATLYNTLELLLEGALLRRHQFEGLPTQYERASAVPHNHLVCTTCGKVKDVRDTELMAYMNARKYNAFTAERLTLTVYGTCSTCARKRNKQSRDSARNNTKNNKKYITN